MMLNTQLLANGGHTLGRSNKKVTVCAHSWKSREYMPLLRAGSFLKGAYF